MLDQFSNNLWTLEGKTIPFFVPPFPTYFPYTLRMVVIRLENDSLFIHSPVQLSDEIKEVIDRLGSVRHIVSPNKLHHLYMGNWSNAYPEAKLYASPGLKQKRADLTFSTTLTDIPEPEWAQEVEQCVFKGSFFMEEVVFFHRPSATLILGDLIENHDPANFSPSQRFFARMNCMLAPNGETPLNFRLSFWKRNLSRTALKKILFWQPQQIIMMHGPCVNENANEFLRNGFGWLLK